MFGMISALSTLLGYSASPNVEEYFDTDDQVVAEVYPSISSLTSPSTTNSASTYHGSPLNGKQHHNTPEPMERPRAARSSPAKTITINSRHAGANVKVISDGKASRDLEKQLEISFSSMKIAPAPATIIRHGSITMFKNGTSLKAYQSLDLQRLCDRERGEKVCGTFNNTGFLLAYEMGLGKTVVALALICYNPSTNSSPRATLIVCPSVAIISHWHREVQKFAPGLEVLVYHGNGRTIDPKVIGNADVVLVTYNEVFNQHHAFLVSEAQKAQLYLTGGLRFPLYRLKFHRVVLDEAHWIRNPDSKSAAACWALRKSHGLCLTGTPAQNKIRDFYSLFKFLQVTYRDIDRLEDFDKLITAPLNQGRSTKANETLMSALKISMIYRPIKPPKGGKPLIDLPPRYDHVIPINLTLEEQHIYEYICDRHPFTSPFARLIRMRQACDHPFLLMNALDPEDVDDDEEISSDTDNKAVIKYLGRFPPDLIPVRDLFDPTYISTKMTAVLSILDTIKRKPRPQKTILFSHSKVMLSLIGDALDDCQIRFITYTGDTTAAAREQVLQRISTDDECTIILCPSWQAELA